MQQQNYSQFKVHGHVKNLYSLSWKQSLSCKINSKSIDRLFEEEHFTMLMKILQEEHKC